MPITISKSITRSMCYGRVEPIAEVVVAVAIRVAQGVDNQNFKVTSEYHRAYDNEHHTAT